MQNAEPPNYLRRDLAFALAMTANGDATVIRTSVKTNTKPNMIFPAFFGLRIACRQIGGYHPLAGGNARKVAVGKIED